MNSETHPEIIQKGHESFWQRNYPLDPQQRRLDVLEQASLEAIAPYIEKLKAAGYTPGIPYARVDVVDAALPSLARGINLTDEKVAVYLVKSKPVLPFMPESYEVVLAYSQSWATRATGITWRRFDRQSNRREFHFYLSPNGDISKISEDQLGTGYFRRIDDKLTLKASAISLLFDALKDNKWHQYKKLEGDDTNWKLKKMGGR